MDTKSILKQNKNGLNSYLSFFQTGCLNNAKEPSVPFYFPFVQVKIDEFMSVLNALERSKTQTALPRI